MMSVSCLVIVLSLGVVLVKATVYECEAGWVLSQKSGKCYLFDYEHPASFEETKRWCENKEADMLILKSYEEQRFVVNKLKQLQNLNDRDVDSNIYKKYHVWLGGKQTPPGGVTIQWFDGTKTPESWRGWTAPRHPIKDCEQKYHCCSPSLTLISGPYAWIDAKCETAFTRACQKAAKDASAEEGGHEEGHNDASSLASNIALALLTLFSTSVCTFLPFL